MLVLLRRLFQFFLVVGKQSMNLPVRVGADGVNLRSEFLPRSSWVLVEQILNPVMVLGH